MNRFFGIPSIFFSKVPLFRNAAPQMVLLAVYIIVFRQIDNDAFIKYSDKAFNIDLFHFSEDLFPAHIQLVRPGDHCNCRRIFSPDNAGSRNICSSFQQRTVTNNMAWEVFFHRIERAIGT